MGKLSISVPAELEKALRARAKAEDTTISAILTEAAERDLRLRERRAVAARMVEESIDLHGEPTADQVAQVESDLATVEEFFAAEQPDLEERKAS